MLKNKAGAVPMQSVNAQKSFCEILPKISHLFPTPDLLILSERVKNYNKKQTLIQNTQSARPRCVA